MTIQGGGQSSETSRARWWWWRGTRRCVRPCTRSTAASTPRAHRSRTTPSPCQAGRCHSGCAVSCPSSRSSSSDLGSSNSIIYFNFQAIDTSRCWTSVVNILCGMQDPLAYNKSNFPFLYFVLVIIIVTVLFLYFWNIFIFLIYIRFIIVCFYSSKDKIPLQYYANHFLF